MIVFMMYGILIAALIALACHAVEACLIAIDRSARFVWVLGLCAGVFLPVAILIEGATSTSPVRGGSEIVGVVAPGAKYDAGSIAPPRVSPFESIQNVLSRWDRAALLAWVLSSLLLLSAILFLALRARAMMRHADATVMSGAQVRVTTQAGPALVGVFNYQIIVPRWVLEFPQEQQALIVAHEQEHARVFDPVLVLFAALAVVAFPWNVSLWYAVRRLRTSVEIDCDRRVLSRVSDAHAYGSLLLDVGARISGRPFFAAALSASASQLHMRISAMSPDRRSLHRMRVGALVVGSVALLGAAFSAPHPKVSLPDANALGELNRSAVQPLAAAGLPAAKPNVAVVLIESDRATREVLVYATKTARVAVGELQPRIGSDTLRLRTPAAVTADITGGEVHIVSRDGSAIRVTVAFRDSPAIRSIAEDVHTVLKQGGIGVSTFSYTDVGDPPYFEYQVQKPAVQLPGFGAPVYPAALRAARVGGEVQAQFVVSEKGEPEVSTFKVLMSTNELFVAAVRSALPNMRFDPAEAGGKKVKQLVHQSFIFRLDPTSDGR